MNALRLSRSDDLPPVRETAGLAELWAWTIPVALLGSWTCFAAVPGVNWTLWTGAAAAGFLALNRRAGRQQPDRYARAALALAFFLAIAAAVTASPQAHALIFVSVAGLFTFAVLSLTIRADEIGPSALVRAPLDVSRRLLAEAAARIADTFAVLRMSAAIPVLRGSSLGLALAGTLFLLLSAADPTMAGWRELAWQAILSRTCVARDVFFLLLTVLLLGAYGLAARAAPPIAQGSSRESLASPAAGISFSGLERLIVLGAASALFIVFFAAELSSHLASPWMQLPAGETFAEATHRGFGEMIVAAALCALVIITLDQRALRSGREAGVRLVAWGVVAASLVVVASAYQRVRYYETAYGYTEQRLYVQACCGAVSVALLLLAWELRRAIGLARLMRRVALAGIAGVAALSYWNSAAWIVDANVARYQSTGKLDVNYLERLGRLSPDAVPALLAALPRLAPADARGLSESLRQTPLDRSDLVPRAGAGSLRWYEWSVRRTAARTALREAGLTEATSH
jgi:Domain of unknown function (DUF4153)